MKQSKADRWRSLLSAWLPNVMTSNRAAYALYASCGFETYGIERQASAVGGRYCDMAHMVLQLSGA
jgi:L-amino acid N-acyltransferase YncA